MRRPTIKTPCVADRYHIGPERIAEFSNSKGIGGLIAVRELPDGRLLVSLYRLDDKVIVSCSPAHYQPEG